MKGIIKWVTELTEEIKALFRNAPKLHRPRRVVQKNNIVTGNLVGGDFINKTTSDISDMLDDMLRGSNIGHKSNIHINGIEGTHNINVNGKEIRVSGKNISVINGVVKVDGKIVETGISPRQSVNLTLIVEDNAEVHTLNVSGDVDVANKGQIYQLSSTGDMDITASNGLMVTQKMDTHGDLTIRGKLDCMGIIVHGDMDVAGDVLCANIKCDGDMDVSGKIVM